MTATAYDVVVVGGGPAGLTTALYTTRLGLDTALVDRGGGRAAMMADTHNVIGVTEDVSGVEFLQTATEQVESYGADVHQAFVSDVRRVDGTGADDTGADGTGADAVTGADADPVEGEAADDDAKDVGEIDVDDEPDRFVLETETETFTARRVVLATGFADGRPDPPLPPTGRGLHYCLHCDAYMFVDEPVYVMGTGDSAAYVAMIMLNFTDEVDVLTRGEEPAWSDGTATLLENHPVGVVHEGIEAVSRDDDGWLESFTFADGTVRNYRGGFPMYGSEFNTGLHDALGCELNDDGTVAVDDHGRTTVDGVYAVGDVTPGHNQIPVAMGEGAKAGIAIHMDLRPFPRSLAEIETSGPVDASDVPAISPDLLATAVAHEGHAAGPRSGAERVADDD